ncbi:MAG: twin-arginine translocation signal domain-containing protein, partial [Planctomycetota bacterium]|nr:twin-arginine translocation signal domain-containing protein [Planctomycetota bacterium]
MSQRTNTRRSFLKKTAGAAIAVPTIATVPLMGEDAPSNKATIGFIGTGNNGTNWMGRFLGDKRMRVVSVCDVNKEG